MSNSIVIMLLIYAMHDISDVIIKRMWGKGAMWRIL